MGTEDTTDSSQALNWKHWYILVQFQMWLAGSSDTGQLSPTIDAIVQINYYKAANDLAYQLVSVHVVYVCRCRCIPIMFIFHIDCIFIPICNHK